MNEFEKAYLAMSKELIFNKNDCVRTPSNLDNMDEILGCSLKTKIFYDKNSQKVFLFTYDKDVLDCEILLKDINILTKQNKINLSNYTASIFLDSTLLLGGSESSNPLFPYYFGSLDSNTNIGLDEDKPLYYFSPKDEAYNQGTLLIFLSSSTLTLLNYSLIDSSLNIKLELTNKESKAKQQQAKVKALQQIQSIKQSTPLSTAFLHPILEDNEIQCPHKGVVQLKSNIGKNFKSNNIPLILESDLLGSLIVGCKNSPINGGACSSVALILPSARGLKKHNGDYPIMQDLVSNGCFTDKGFPLICTRKPNTFKINSPNPTLSSPISKEALASHIQLTQPILRLHYKIYPSQKDNLPIYRIKCNDTIIESNNDMPLDSIHIDIAKDTKALDDISKLDSSLQDILSNLYSTLKQIYIKGYIYRYLYLQLDTNALLLILLIPQHIPKVFKELYKDYKHKDYGIGRYHYLFAYCTNAILEIADYTQIRLDSNPNNATILTLQTPYKTQKIALQLASGLDSIIESRDREQQTKKGESTTKSKEKDSTNTQYLHSILTLPLINGGYKEKWWGFEIDKNKI